MADPQIIAAVLQAVLSMQQHDNSSSSRKVLTESELQGNSFRPATVIGATAAAGPNSCSSSNGGSSDGFLSVWQLLARTVVAGGSATTDGVGEQKAQQQQQSSSGGASSSSGSSRVSAAAVPLNTAAAESKLGALGMLLGQRGALHTLPTTTLQHLPRISNQQQQPTVDVQQQEVDIAGLLVPEHHCCLLNGKALVDGVEDVKNH